MVLSKRGILFTLVTIIILSLFMASYTTYTFFKDRSSINNRIMTLNNFVSSLEQDIPREIYISSYRAIFLIDKYELNNGVFVANVNDSLNELFFNGTINGTSEALMDDATFSSIEGFLSANAKKINANVVLQNPTISISQVSPWNMKVVFNITLSVKDKNNLAEWTRNSSVVTFIPVQNFNDPVYSVNTAGRIVNKINKTSYSNFVSGADYTNLTNQFHNSLYMASVSAPSFLMRLEGNLSASPNGIESLVNPQKLISQNIIVKYKSVVDYIYFSNFNPQKYKIPTVANLILDNQSNHLFKYNVSDVAIPA